MPGFSVKIPGRRQYPHIAGMAPFYHMRGGRQRVFVCVQTAQIGAVLKAHRANLVLYASCRDDPFAQE